MKQFFHDLMTEGNPRSSRRFVTLVTALLFLGTTGVIPILLFVLFVYVQKLQGLNVEALKLIVSLVETVIYCQLGIVVMGLFVTTQKGRIQVLKTLFKKSDDTVDYSSPQTPPYDPIQPGLPDSGQ